MKPVSICRRMFRLHFVTKTFELQFTSPTAKASYTSWRLRIVVATIRDASTSAHTGCNRQPFFGVFNHFVSGRSPAYRLASETMPGHGAGRPGVTDNGSNGSAFVDRHVQCLEHSTGRYPSMRHRQVLLICCCGDQMPRKILPSYAAANVYAIRWRGNDLTPSI